MFFFTTISLLGIWHWNFINRWTRMERIYMIFQIFFTLLVYIHSMYMMNPYKHDTFSCLKNSKTLLNWRNLKKNVSECQSHILIIRSTPRAALMKSVQHVLNVLFENRSVRVWGKIKAHVIFLQKTWPTLSSTSLSWLTSSRRLNVLYS
jgi:hypothetical protein